MIVFRTSDPDRWLNLDRLRYAEAVPGGLALHFDLHQVVTLDHAQAEQLRAFLDAQADRVDVARIGRMGFAPPTD